MRRFRVRIGSLFGVRLYLHASWFPVFGALVTLSAFEFEGLYPRVGTGARFGMGVATGVLFFGSLLAHELAHAVMARRIGVPVKGITLFMFGGVAEIGAEARRPGDEFRVAVVGPLTSVGLAAAFAGLSALSTALELPPVEGVTTVVSIANVVVALFNLVPGLPLDGGRLLRAAVWRATGNRDRATRIAAWAGVVVAGLLAAAGAGLVLAGEWAGAWYVVVGWFLGRLAVSSMARAAPVRTAGDRAGPAGSPAAPAVAWEQDEGPPAKPRS